MSGLVTAFQDSGTRETADRTCAPYPHFPKNISPPLADAADWSALQAVVDRMSKSRGTLVRFSANLSWGLGAPIDLDRMGGNTCTSPTNIYDLMIQKLITSHTFESNGIWGMNVVRDSSPLALHFVEEILPALPQNFEKKCKTLRDVADQIVSEVGRLQPGWDGDDGIIPSRQTIHSLATVISLLPRETPLPDVEVDGSDGSVAFRWISKGRDRVLSATILEGQVTILLSERNRDFPSAKLPISDPGQIARMVITAFETLNG